MAGDRNTVAAIMGGVVNNRRMGKGHADEQRQAQQSGKPRLHDLCGLHLCGRRTFGCRLIRYFYLSHMLAFPKQLGRPKSITSENTSTLNKYNKIPRPNAAMS